MTAATIDTSASRPPVRLTAGTLEIVFEWEGDRWRHRVVHRGRLVAESVEGAGPDGDPRWPASPALQEVSVAATADGVALLAVGAAGRAHFSASLTVEASQPDTVLVEAACRIHDAPGWLGSTYRMPGGDVARAPAVPAPAPPCTVEWAYRLDPGGILPVTRRAT